MKITLNESELRASFHATVLEAAAANGALGQEALAELSALSAELLPLAVAETQQQLAGDPNAAGYLAGLGAIIESKAGELAERGINVNRELLRRNVDRWSGILAGLLPAVANGVIPGSGVLVSAAIAAAEAGNAKPANG